MMSPYFKHKYLDKPYGRYKKIGYYKPILSNPVILVLGTHLECSTIYFTNVHSDFPSK